MSSLPLLAAAAVDCISSADFSWFYRFISWMLRVSQGGLNIYLRMGRHWLCKLLVDIEVKRLRDIFFSDLRQFLCYLTNSAVASAALTLLYAWSVLIKLFQAEAEQRKEFGQENCNLPSMDVGLESLFCQQQWIIWKFLAEISSRGWRPNCFSCPREPRQRLS